MSIIRFKYLLRILKLKNSTKYKGFYVLFLTENKQTVLNRNSVQWKAKGMSIVVKDYVFSGIGISKNIFTKFNILCQKLI